MKFVRLGDVAVINPTWDKWAGLDDPVSFVGMASMSDEAGKTINEEARTVSQVRKGFTPFRQDDLLVAKITPCFENGKIGRAAIKNRLGAGSTEFHVVRPGKDLDGAYALHFLRRPSFRTAGELRMTGSGGQRRVPAAYVADTKIPLPPLDEQRRIAAILDKADVLRTKRREALAHLDTLTQSIFHSMFEEMEFPVVPLGSVAAFFGGNSLPEGHAFENQPTGYLLLKVSDMNRSGNERRLVTAGSWSETPGSKASTCPAGCVVLPKRGASISTNKKRMTVRPSVLDPNLMAVEPSPALDPAYLFAWFENFDLTAITSGSSVPQLNKQDLRPLPFSVPPLELQQTFATRVAAVERLKELHRKHLAELDALFASLQHRAFKGEL